MRFNLITQTSAAASRNAGAIPLSLTLRPSCGITGEYTFATDSSTLLNLLKLETDLPSTVLTRFMRDLAACAKARLFGVELNDRVLRGIGFFVD